MKNLIGFCLVVVFANLSWGQTTFSVDKEKFVKEFQKVLSDYGRGDYTELAKKQLPKLLDAETGNFPDPLFVKMVATSNLILEKKLKPYPELYNYVYSIVSLFKNGQNQESFKAWHVTIDQMLDSRNVKRFEDFVELTAGFFSEQIITTASNFTWFYEGGTYSFDFIDSPIIRFKDGNLICRVQNSVSRNDKKNPYVDSIVVYNTSGAFDPLLKKWNGNGGVVTWEKVGLSKNENYATLKSYDVALKSSNFNADSVVLVTPYFAQPIDGQLIERAFIINRETDRVFPQFNSYSRDLSIKALRKDMNFKGGMTLRGANFEGTGTSDKLAEITLLRSEKPFIILKSQLFFVSKETIRSNRAVIFMNYADGDSITHPGAEIIYQSDKESIELRRTRKGIGQAPFTNSYHQVDMYVPKLIWENGSDSLRISFDYGLSDEQRIARLESKNYFDGRLYDQLQGLSSMHPLVAITNYAAVHGRYGIPDGKLASAMGKTIDQAKITFFELANMGFITYDAEEHFVDVNQKTINFAEARSAQRDYDNIAFVSDFRPKRLSQYSDEEIAKDPVLSAVKMNYDKMNLERSMYKDFGSIGLKKLDIFLRGVDQVGISEAQMTAVFPSNYELEIHKNRDFDFVGYLNSGKIDINVQQGQFLYDDFKFAIQKSINTRFHVKPMRKEDGNKAITMVSELSGITGEVLIDDPYNRSGLDKKITTYPKLITDKPSYIFYNSPRIYKGAYDSTRFYYTIEPFVIDSLDNFSEAHLMLKGELTSAGIFPKFKQALHIMPDYSFGFITKTPPGGFQFYGGSAKYENSIVLSGRGLQGDGTIRYLNSVSTSENFAFLPDSTVGFVEFTNKQSEVAVQFPEVYGKNVYLTYLPKTDLLRVSTTDRGDLVFFKEQAKLRGSVFLRPNGMEGMGLMNFTNASMTSDRFKYNCYEILSDDADFTLRNNAVVEGEDKVAFKTEGVKANVSFKERKGVFNSTEKGGFMEFPVNKFKCKMDKFVWYMDKDNIEMESTSSEVASNSGIDFIAPNFFSTNNRRDTLAFRAPKANFSYQEKTIYCDRVEYVDVADARVFPSDKKLTIRKEAKLDPVTDAKILANYITKYYTFVRANVNIQNRTTYTASGEYPYYDRDSNVTYIVMESIGLDTSNQTVANGKIRVESDFQLSPEFAFYGEMFIRASEPFATFKGATKVSHNCEKFNRSWLSFEASINPKDIQIPVSSEMRNLEGEKISAGLVWRDSRLLDSIRIYPTFLSSLLDQNDPVMLTSSGFLRYDNKLNQYQIAPKEKFINPKEKGNVIILNTKTCALSGEGLIDIGMNYGDVQVLSYGTADYDQKSGVTDFNLTMKIKMDMDKRTFEDVGLRIATAPGVEPMDMTSTNLEAALVNLADQKTADKFKSDLLIKGEVKKMPDVFEDGFVFTDVRLRSFEKPEFQERGLITARKTASLVNIYGQPIFKNVDFEAFFLQTQSDVSADKFMILFGLSPTKVYYLDYTMMKKDGDLRMVSSDKDFVATVNAIKEDKRKSRNFTWGITDQNIFVARFNRLMGRRE